MDAESLLNINKKINNKTICLDDLDLEVIDKYSSCFYLIPMSFNLKIDGYAWDNFKHAINNNLLNKDNIPFYIKTLQQLFDGLTSCMMRIIRIDYKEIITMKGILCSLENLLDSYEIINKLS